ncbi:MAG: ABC transporter [bacterium (Candidatus Stahlbacteria) CG08_land_8_20_14_0_20_40_26]|nr:MAG: ABC transporter [bacterium (Candidatus Stahlbacteria) CG23_combo_of_CG06-09_8_20_14_all_40_9]PIS23965.1 MAG: ABC transporter [bacterium (Candidatus Stahlbacteria) CG08_land_8_20_14_0_20_40_26]
MNTVILVSDVTKRYEDIVAVNKLTFGVKKGEIFGLLGPNGAGKTTTVEMIEGLRVPDSGSIEINSVTVSDKRRELKEIIGVGLQETSMYDKIRVEEILSLFKSYYRKSSSIDEIIEIISLRDKRKSFVEDLSGGQRKRLTLGLAMVNDPEILILDEPTTGLDPQARRNLWSIIQTLKAHGKTILLTTHYMEEAERLCDRVLIIDKGRKIVIDTPEGLIAQLEIDKCLELYMDTTVDKDVFEKLPGVNEVVMDRDKLILYTNKSDETVRRLIELSKGGLLKFRDLHIKKATLEDVFIKLTGSRIRE